MNRNKTPGSDALTAEFYSTFWNSLGPLLVEVFLMRVIEIVNYASL